jgi:hypothetical protein
MVTLFVSSLTGFFLFSYLQVVRQQQTMVKRSEAWNGALAAAEAGAEEALAQLNPGVPLPIVDRTANGWGAPSGGLYGPMSRTLSPGAYDVVFTTDTFPTIYATGYVSVAGIPATLARTIRVNTTNVPLFTAGLSAMNNINMSGNGIVSDSFNSSLPTLSNNGSYDPTRASTNGDVASMAGVVNVANANIQGSVLLGPGAADTVKPNGTVTGGVINDFNFDFPDVILPQTSWLPAMTTNLTIDGVSYQYVFTTSTGDYSINGLNGSVYVGTNSHIRLKVTGNASPSIIRVAGLGTDAGSLQFFMDGPTFNLSGQSIVDGGVPNNLSYLGTTNNTSINCSGNATFIGTIYAPEASFKLGGGGSSTYDFIGAAIVNNATVNGHFQFHYDEALLTTGPIRGYAAASWQEL